MANEKRIIVEIKVTNEGSGEQNQPGSPNDTNQKNKKKTKEEKATAYAIESAKRVGGAIINSAELSLNRYFSMSENYMAEVDYQNTLNVIQKASSLGMTVISGAKVGAAAGGVIGAAVGTILSAAVWTGNEYTAYRQKMSNYYQNLNAANYQTEFDKTRLGLINEGKGTEN